MWASQSKKTSSNGSNVRGSAGCCGKIPYGGASPTAGKPWMTPSSIVTSSQDMRMTNRPNQPRSCWPVAAQIAGGCRWRKRVDTRVHRPFSSRNARMERCRISRRQPCPCAIASAANCRCGHCRKGRKGRRAGGAGPPPCATGVAAEEMPTSGPKVHRIEDVREGWLVDEVLNHREAKVLEHKEDKDLKAAMTDSWER